MLPKGPRQGATLEAGGHIDDGPRSLCDVATTRGVDALVSTMPQGGLDYCTSEDGNPFPGIVINRAPYCEQTGCKKHCKEWTIVLAARMMIPMLAYIYFVCGVLGIPILIGNVGLHSQLSWNRLFLFSIRPHHCLQVGGTGCRLFFQVLYYTLGLLPDEILAFITVAPENTHAHNLCWLPIGKTLDQHLEMVRRYVTGFFGIAGGLFRRLRFRKQRLGSSEELPSTNDMSTALSNNDVDAPYYQHGTPEGDAAGRNAMRLQRSAIGRLGGLASWNDRVESDGREAALAHMAELGRASAAALKTALGDEGYRDYMADLGRLGGRASAAARRTALGDEGYCEYMADIGRLGSAKAAGIDVDEQDALLRRLKTTIASVTRSTGFEDLSHDAQLSLVLVSARSSFSLSSLSRLNFLDFSVLL